MNIFIVLAHPEPNHSFNAAMIRRSIEALESE